MKNKKGMSLLGLLISLLIVMILLQIILPRYQKTMLKSQQQTRQTLDELKGTIRQAEKEAARRADTNLNF